MGAGSHLLLARARGGDVFALTLQAVERLPHWRNAGSAAYRCIADFQPAVVQRQSLCASGWEDLEAVGCVDVWLAGAGRLPNEREVRTLIVTDDDGRHWKGGRPIDVPRDQLTVAIKQSDAWITVQMARRRSSIAKREVPGARASGTQFAHKGETQVRCRAAWCCRAKTGRRRGARGENKNAAHQWGDQASSPYATSM